MILTPKQYMPKDLMTQIETAGDAMSYALSSRNSEQIFGVLRADIKRNLDPELGLSYIIPRLETGLNVAAQCLDKLETAVAEIILPNDPSYLSRREKARLDTLCDMAGCIFDSARTGARSYRDFYNDDPDIGPRKYHEPLIAHYIPLIEKSHEAITAHARRQYQKLAPTGNTATLKRPVQDFNK